MSRLLDQHLQTHPYEPQPAAANLVQRLFAQFCDRSADARRFSARLLEATGTRLIDWTDHLGLPETLVDGPRLEEAGFRHTATGTHVVWEHPEAVFPEIVAIEQSAWRLALRVESVADFLAAHSLKDTIRIEGDPQSQFRKARIGREADAELWIAERHGYRGWDVADSHAAEAESVLRHQAAFGHRQRRFTEADDGFEHAQELIRAAAADLGTAWASDLFFAAEREFWARRNRAARFQKARQDALGLGWGNHDHHTYRSSRRHFAHLIQILERLGLVCRERLYAGRDAGWGAQVLEHEASGIVVFADVDLGPAEVVEDFAHEPLPPQAAFGTVGLWCLLHGEAFLQPGMHHLECRFAFDTARKQFEQSGIRVLKPFTDQPHLKQAFTEGELWPVDASRLEAALAAKAITPAQAEQFRQAGVLGSHLEILERNQGYKGFNQTGIDEIIRDTDPRK